MDRWLKGATCLLVLASVALLASTFRRDAGGDRFHIADLETLPVVNLEGGRNTLGEVLGGQNHFRLFVELSNCDTCIYKGLNDLSALQKAGHPCTIFVIHDYQEEVHSWSVHAKGIPVYRVARDDFYVNVDATTLPVLCTFAENQIKKFRVITLAQ